jgi:uncharacterized protein
VPRNLCSDHHNASGWCAATGPGGPGAEALEFRRAAHILSPMLVYEQLPLLFCTGLAAGFVDSIAGGGGLITLPVLLSCGLGPAEALGTNKLQATFGSASAAGHYTAAKAVSLRECARGFGYTFLGAAAGAVAVQQLDPSVLRRAIPLLLITVAAYVLCKPKLGAHDLQPQMQRATFDLVFGLALGFYDGFFGPGTGTFWAMAYVLVLGFNLTRATGHTKVMNFASNLSSLLFFLFGGKIRFVIGLTMGFGQLLGARIGANMVITRGTALIRPVFVGVVLLLTLKLLYDGFAR